MRYILLITLLLGITGCEDLLFNPDTSKTGETLDSSAITGAWGNTIYNDSLVTLSKLKALPDDDYGILFLQDGKLTENKNAGWCGTPPISYAEFSGLWDLSADSVLTVETSYWGGKIWMEWKLLSVDPGQFTYYILSQEYLDEE
jgi:hypothetical protein